jgi:1-deoxy-D-xylulose-5-phosphate synthase
MDLPVTFALDRAGLVEDGPTHHGIYDLGFLLGMNNLTVMQPACEAEVPFMLEYAIKLNAPAVIRYPRGSSKANLRNDIPPVNAIERPESIIWRNGTDLAIHAVGAEAVRALAVADILQNKYQLSAKVVNVRFLKPFVEDILLEDLKTMPVFTLEDHVVSTGFGSIAAQSAARLNTQHQLHSFGIPGNRTASFGAIDALRKTLDLDTETLAEKIASVIK